MRTSPEQLLILPLFLVLAARASDGLAQELPPPRSRDVEDLARTPLDRALEDAARDEAPPRDIASRRFGDVNLRLIDLSFDALIAAGGSSERDESLQTLQGGGHDPRKRGFTIQNVELSLIGAVDPYFNAEAHIIFFVEPLSGETIVELEEVFATTMALPYGLELEAGLFLTEFGRINPRHPHAWDWLDQPVINTRLFGPDGLRAPGLRLGWLTPLPWFSELHAGMQNAGGETLASFLASEEFFEERPIAGRPFVERDVRGIEDFLYLARWVNSWDLSDEVTAVAGFSGLFGPNASGPEGRTRIYGTDFLVRWRPVDNDRGWPFVSWQTEIMGRDYEADAFFDEGDPADPDDDIVFSRATLHDWGFYSQLLYGFVRNWAAGVRYEFARGGGASSGMFASRFEDPFRNDRQRLSPIIAWIPTEFSRVRLQYNYDWADHIEGGDAHSVWIGLEVLFGSHPAHTY
jgi:hypothetical protein